MNKRNKIKTKFKKIKLKVKVIFILILLIIGIRFVTGYFSERVKLYVKETSINNASKNIVKALNEDVLNTLEIDNIYDETKGYINTKNINNILKEVNSYLSININDYTNNRIKIPIGLILSEVLFSKSQVGLSIYTKPISSFTTDIVSSVEDYGLNNSLIKVELVVKINIVALIPLNNEVYDVITHVPLVYIIREGKIPNGLIYTK